MVRLRCIDEKNISSGNYLIEVYRAYKLYDEENVVYWCEECGVVSIDKESDGKKIGFIIPMKFPLTLKEKL